ncbi:MAG: HEAT repeat domain-containing protein, partial [Endomicrobiia bacterium]
MKRKIILISIIFFILFLGIKSYIMSQQQNNFSKQQVDPFDEAIKNVSSSDPYIRRQAAEQLGMLKDPRAIVYLKKLLKDENPYVRQTAVDSLG